MHEEIRFAREEDCERMLELVRELANYEKAPQEVTVTLQHFKETGFGENPIWKAFVATVNDEIVGFALYYVRYSTWKGARLYLEDFIVTENMRGKGLGKKLFERVLKQAKADNYQGVVWQVLDWNQPGINFYNKYNASFDGGWLNASLSAEQLAKYV
ncbi:GNAT family N-acetyltransferase [Pelobium manganitolerans]|uniref:GNAT family N-acetyltransferase n=1 Tax=Pelobium manganitolerans TaxID=1842495 RepID=UPI003FA39EDA